MLKFWDPMAGPVATYKLDRTPMVNLLFEAANKPLLMRCMGATRHNHATMRRNQIRASITSAANHVNCI